MKILEYKMEDFLDQDRDEKVHKFESAECVKTLKKKKLCFFNDFEGLRVSLL